MAIPATKTITTVTKDMAIRGITDIMKTIMDIKGIMTMEDIKAIMDMTVVTKNTTTMTMGTITTIIRGTRAHTGMGMTNTVTGIKDTTQKDIMGLKNMTNLRRINISILTTGTKVTMNITAVFTTKAVTKRVVITVTDISTMDIMIITMARAVIIMKVDTIMITRDIMVMVAITSITMVIMIMAAKVVMGTISTGDTSLVTKLISTS